MSGPMCRRLTAALALALLAAGCEGDPNRPKEAQAVADVINHVFYHAKWQQIPATPENQAEAIVFQQSVLFRDGSAILDRRAEDAIDALIMEAAPDPGTTVLLSAGSGAANRYDRLALQRLESVRMALADRGYETVLGQQPQEVPAAPPGGNEVRLTLAKYMPILPDCSQPQPLEPHPPAFDPAFGCSNAHNLGVMVANPADLVQGRTLEPGDGEAQSLSIQRYRVGKITPLDTEDTKSQ
ncbi:CpaD family pilus assembly lipoprotein [Pelagibius sp.]|uniref:CpaD family pilus assembly lipoprotein n=1 Tax=Pelagibius sp. TaxID=1931238 RepID=UPI00260341ED|nr:CpaD family pilus assembly lipoprotein [Pelagibius sp.]